jgi:anti-anti-sigma regulatory factor
MLEITKESTGSDSIVLLIRGELTIAGVTELREAILQGFDEAERLEIDVEEVSEIDFFALQMICSAHRTSVLRKKLLTWSGAKPTTVAQVIKKSGFSRHCGCNLCPSTIDCMWL